MGLDRAVPEIDESRRPGRKVTPVELATIVATVAILAALLVPDFLATRRDDRMLLPPELMRQADAGLRGLAGTYQLGFTGRHWELRITPDGRYGFVWRTCTGIREKDRGFVHVVGDRLLFSPWVPKLKAGGSTWHPGAAGLRIIRWGTRRYLVSDAQIPRLRNEIREGNEPRTEPRGWLFLHENDWDEPAPTLAAIARPPG